MEVVVGATLQSVTPLTIVVVFNFWGFCARAVGAPASRTRPAVRVKSAVHAEVLGERDCEEELSYFIK
jgi:hypothetical protein